MSLLNRVFTDAGRAMCKQANDSLQDLINQAKKVKAFGPEPKITCEEIAGRPDLGETYFINGHPILWFGPIEIEQVPGPHYQIRYRVSREVKQLGLEEEGQ